MEKKEPWSKKHKRVINVSAGGLPYNFSNSFAQPLTNKELMELTHARGDYELLEEYNNHTLSYTPNGGSQDLREEIAKLYGSAITANNIIVFAGAQVALQTAAIALASDCHSIVFTPGYQSTIEAPEHAGGQITRITLKASNNWQINPQEVQDAIRENTRYMVLNEPFNPTGTLMSPLLQLQLQTIAQKHGIYIMCDEVYRLLEHDSNDRLPAMSDLYFKGISVVTLSKPWGGCGITIGWLAFQDLSIKQKLIDVQYFSTACPSRASEIQAIMVLRASEIILKKNRNIIRYNLNLLNNFIKEYNEFFEWVHPKAGAIAFVKFKGPLTSEQLGDQLASSGIGIKPAYCFSDPVIPDLDSYFRIGYGEEIMPTNLNALIRFVEENKQSWRTAIAHQLH